MRVIHFLQPHEHQGGDPLVPVVNLAKAQAAKGHDVGIVCVDESSGSIVLDNLTNAQKFCSLGAMRIRVDQRNNFSRILTLLPSHASAVRFALKHSPELLHAHGMKGEIIMHHVRKALARKKQNPVRVFSPHGSVLNSVKSVWPFSASRKQPGNTAHGIIFNSRHGEKNHTERYGPPRCPSRIIYDGLDEEEFAPRLIIDMASDFLFVGEIKSRNGIGTLIKALARMKKTHKTGALIVGSGPDENESRKQVNRYGLSHEVFFNAPVIAKSAFLKGGCLVLPAKGGPLPHIFLQAAAAGVPMILTDIEAVREMVGTANIPLIPADDTSALQEQMAAYLTNPQLFLARAAALKQHVAEHFTLARMSEETDEFYASLNT